jgi:hypothetical protein
MHRKVFLKSTSANRMLQWIDEQFSVRAIVLLIRHPCAVVASMCEFRRWSHATPDRSFPSLDHVLEGVPSHVVDQVQDRLPESIDTKEEALALRWALDYHIPFYLNREYGYPWILVPYERLVASGETEVKRVFNFLEECPPPEALNRLGRSSNSATESTIPKDVRRQLAKWKRRLEETQIDSILRIAHSFGLDFYGRALEPNYEEMSAFQIGRAHV